MLKKYSKYLYVFVLVMLMTSGYFLIHNSRAIKSSNIADIRSKVWNSYIETMSNDPERKSEFENQEMQYDQVVMKYKMFFIGDAPEGGYPLYIALHGGGTDSKELHDQQWQSMEKYYRTSVKVGVYVAPRGVRDTYDVHSNPESYPLYDRLIENMILFANVNPNRIYILGFSAGGDGVYQITPRMADRFAAANMSAGHPGNVSVKNLRNLPFIIQVGEKDSAYSRHWYAAVYNMLLSDLEKSLGGYYHQTIIHYDKPHNFRDNSLARDEQTIIADIEAWYKDYNRSTTKANTNAVDLVSEFERNPYPEKIVWDMSTCASKRDIRSFYWIHVNNDSSRTQGEIIAHLDAKTNSIIVDSSTVYGSFTFLLNEKMLDIFKPVNFQIEDQHFKVNIKLSEKFLEYTTFERGDVNFQFPAGIVLNRENDEWHVTGDVEELLKEDKFD